MEERKEGSFEETAKRKRRRKGDGDAAVPIDDPIRPDSGILGAEAELPEPIAEENSTTSTIKEDLIVGEPAPVEKNYAEFLLARKGNLLACRRSSCGRKAYPIGGSLGSLTLEKLAERQGWSITKGKEICSELSHNGRIAWFDGSAVALKRYGSNPVWRDYSDVQHSDHIHDDAIETIFGD